MKSRCRPFFSARGKALREHAAAAGIRHQYNLDNSHTLAMIENMALGMHKHNAISRRISTRIRANGIVALNGGEKPVVTRIYDIGAGGLSFLHVNEKEAAGNQLTMDILLFDVHSDEELLIGHINGRIVSRKLVADPVRKAPAWRYGVEFTGLDARQRRTLKRCVGLALDRCLYARQNPVRNVA